MSYEPLNETELLGLHETFLRDHVTDPAVAALTELAPSLESGSANEAGVISIDDFLKPESEQELDELVFENGQCHAADAIV